MRTHKTGEDAIRLSRRRLRSGGRFWGRALVLAGVMSAMVGLSVAAQARTSSGPVYALRLYDATLNKFTVPTKVPAVGGATLDVVQPNAAGVSTSALSTARKVSVGGVTVPFKFIAPPPPSATGAGVGKGNFNQFGDLRLTLPPHVAGKVSVVVTEPGFTSKPLRLVYG